MSSRAPSFKRRARPSTSPSKATPAPYSTIPVTEGYRQRPGGGLHIVQRTDLYAAGEAFIQPITAGPSRRPSDLFDDDDDEPEIRQTLFTSGAVSSAGKKRMKQWETWRTAIIPQLINPYFDVLYQSQSLRALNLCKEVNCSCGTFKRKLQVTCVYFDCKSIEYPITIYSVHFQQASRLYKFVYVPPPSIYYLVGFFLVHL